MKTGKVLIVEDHPLYSDALVSLVQVMVGDAAALTARSAEEGLALAKVMPDLSLILLDLGLPGMNGVEAIRTFRRNYPAATVIVVSASEDRQEAMVALRTGAAAFISKAVSMEITAELIRRALSKELTEPEWITPTGKSLVSLKEPLAPSLTPRQSEILALLMQGHTNKEISLRLYLAEITVKMHMSTIFRALGVVNRTQAVMAARRLGLYAVDTDDKKTIS